MHFDEGHFNGEITGPNDRKRESAELLSHFAAEAERLGNQLEESDFVGFEREDALELYGRVEMILGALAVVAGLDIAACATQSLFQSGPEQADAMRLLSRLGLAAVGGGGAMLLFKGLAKLESGYHKFRGYVGKGKLRGPNGGSESIQR